MAMVKGGKGGGGVDVDRLLNFEKRSGIKDGDIESFITKVDAVNVAIQAMKARRGTHTRRRIERMRERAGGGGGTQGRGGQGENQACAVFV